MSARRTAAVIGLGLALGTVLIRPALAAPLDLATSCAILFSSQAQTVATVGGKLYVYQWYRMALTRTAVTLDLVVGGPNGSTRYSGFKCATGATGTIAVVSSPLSKSGG